MRLSARQPKQPWLRRSCAWLLATAFVLAAGSAAAQQLDLDDYPKLEARDLAERYRTWVDKDVVWIMTRQEREVFLRLDSDSKRDLFIEEFWRNRDPSPGTERNEYREVHFERIEYATEQYGRETPRKGWQTDRGRIHILLGKPQSTTRLPNTQNTVPVEVWFYSVDPALRLPPFFYLIFFKDNGVGEYRLYSPSIDGPRKLLNASASMQAARDSGGGGAFGPGSRSFGNSEDAAALRLLRDSDAELAQAAASLIPGEGGGLGVSPLRSEIVISQVFNLPNVLMPSAAWSLRVLTGVAESRVRFETLPLQIEARVLIDASGEPFAHFVTRTIGEELNLNNYEDEYYITFDVGSTIRDAELRRVSVQEPRTLQAELAEDRARDLRDGPVQYMQREPIPDGDFVLDVIVENNVSGEFARAELPLRSLDAEPGPVVAGRPLLLFESTNLGDAYDPFMEHYPFQLGSLIAVPALEGPFPQDGEVEVLWQMRMDPSQLAPFFATFELRDAQDRIVLSKMSRVDPASRDRHGIINLLVPLQLRDVAVGVYRLVCGLEPIEQTHSLNLRVVPEADFKRPFVHSQRFPPATAPVTRLERARQLRVLGRTDEAITELAGVLQREPEMREALDLQIELLGDAGRFRDLDRLLTPRLIEKPNDVPLLLELAEVKAELAEHYDAIRYYERARLSGAEETAALLNALASEYYAEGRLDRARELLEKSLQMDPEQPQMRRLLDELLGPAEPR